jgi:hypothetical protein
MIPQYHSQNKNFKRDLKENQEDYFALPFQLTIVYSQYFYKFIKKI